MKLTVHERMALVNLLPTKGDYAALRTIRRAREMLSFTPEELEYYEIKTVFDPKGKPTTSWNPEKSAKTVKDCPVDEYTTHLLQDKLAEMNKKHELTEEYTSVYEKFVIMYK